MSFSQEILPQRNEEELKRIIEDGYDRLLKSATHVLKKYRLMDNIEVDAQDVVQQVITALYANKHELLVTSDDPRYEKVVLNYLQVSIGNRVISMYREKLRHKTDLSGSVDIAPEKVFGERQVVSDASLGRLDDIHDLQDAEYVYALAFGPLSYEGEVDVQSLRLQRKMHVIKMRLEGCSWNDIARDILSDDSRYFVLVNKVRDLENPKDLATAINTLTQMLVRYAPDFLKEVQEDVLRDDEIGGVNLDLIICDHKGGN